MKKNILPSYLEIKKKYPLEKKEKEFLSFSKKKLKNIFLKKEKKLLVFTGPCSIHDEKSTLIYAQKLKDLQKDLKNIHLVMRVYFEKSRTKNSWKGFLYDPKLENTFDLESGLKLTRKLLLKIASLNIPVCSEIVDPNLFSYFDDLISWGFIGARTSSSSVHRNFSSSLDIPVGFKNTLDGDIEAAINASHVSKKPQNFVSINENGKMCSCESRGNQFSHIVLRGSKDSINYREKHLIKSLKLMKKNQNLSPIIIDCSHGNSNRNYLNQVKVFKYCLKNIIDNKYPILGLMLESNLFAGKQALNALNFRFGLSITDPCIDFETTKNLLNFADKQLLKSKTFQKVLASSK